jgi:hypothetical protein
MWRRGGRHTMPIGMKSHGEPHRTTYTWLLMEAHADRLPRLTLEAVHTMGRKEGDEAGRPPAIPLPGKGCRAPVAHEGGPSRSAQRMA